MSRIIVDSIRNSSASSDGITLSSDGKVTFPNTSTGKILQVKTNTTRDSVGSLHCNPTLTYLDIPDQNVTITPSAATSKIRISFHQFGETGSSSHQYSFALKRAISGGATTTIKGTAAGNRGTVLTMASINYHTADNDSTPVVAVISGYLDSPNTTSAVTYTVQIQNHESTGYWYYNRTVGDANNSARERGLSWITVEEVAA